MNNNFLSKFACGAGVFTLMVGAVALSAGPAAAGGPGDGSTSVDITGGTLTASLQSSTLDFGSAGFSFSGQIKTVDSKLVVSDGSGLENGWTIHISASDLTEAGSGDSIGSQALTVTALDTLTSVAGQDTTGVSLSDTTSPLPLSSGGSDVATATTGHGVGEYNANITFSLDVPSMAGKTSGTYGGTYTVTATNV